MTKTFPLSFTIKVMFDISCPWCFIGKRRLERALSQRPDLNVTLDWQALLLAPSFPRHGVPYRWYMEQRFQTTENMTRAQLALMEMGRSVGIDFAFDLIETLPSSYAAHALINLAQQAGCVSEMIDSLFQAFLCEGRNIGKDDVLLSIAEKHELSIAEAAASLHNPFLRAIIQAQSDDGRTLGCTGVPAFIFDNQLVIVGAQEIPVFVHMLDAAAEYVLTQHPRPT